MVLRQFTGRVADPLLQQTVMVGESTIRPFYFYVQNFLIQLIEQVKF